MKIAISQCPNYSLTSAWLLRVCNIQRSSHSDQCWHRNAITPADRIIVPHTADCMPTFLPALVLQRCMLSPSDFYQSQMLNWCSHYLYTRVAAVSRVSAVHGWPRKSAANAFEVVCGNVGGLSPTLFYNVIITVRCRRSARRLLVAHLTQTDQLTWRTSMHLTWRLRIITVATLGERDVDNFCVWIIRNCCPNYWKQKNYSISAKKSCLNY